MYFCGKSHVHPTDPEFSFTHDEQGEVTGPGYQPGKVHVKFPTNKQGVSCFSAELSRVWPPWQLPTGYRSMLATEAADLVTVQKDSQARETLDGS